MSVRLLRGLSTGYLLLPNLLFFFYWTTPLLAVLGVGLLLFLFVRETTDQDLPSGDSLSGKDWAYIGGIALLLTAMSGVAGLCFQTIDYWGHNVKYHDLVLGPWPLAIPEDGPAISYYYGYYLVPALLSKVTGHLNEWFLFLWTWAGLGLGLAWLYVVLEGRILYLLLCLGLGDTPAVLVALGTWLGLPLNEHGGVRLEIMSLTRNLLYVPNQVIPTLIVVGMVAYALKKRTSLQTLTFPIALTLWWAFFPALTCGLLVGILILKQWVQSAPEWPKIARQVVLPVVATLPILLLYESHRGLPDSGFLWQYGDPALTVVAEYGLRIGLNVGIFLLFYLRFARPGSALPPFPFYLLLVLVAGLSLFRMGELNDFMLRGMMPYLLLIGVYLVEPLLAQKSYGAVPQMAGKSVYNLVLVSLLFSSLLMSAWILALDLRVNRVTARLFPERVKFTPIPYDAYENVYEMLKVKFDQKGAEEYLGKEGSLYERYIR